MKPESEPATLVLGLGKTGYSVVAHLAAGGDGGRITVADSRELTPYLARLRAEYPQVAVITGGLPKSLAGYARVVVSPGVDWSGMDAAEAGAEVIGDIELFARAQAKRGGAVIAITGSNGKSTVTTLLGEMLAAAGKRVAVGGNLGTPALELLAGGASSSPPPQIYVLELSSFQLQATHSLRAAAATVLNLSADHLDRHPDFADYAAAKSRALIGAAACVLNRDDPACAELRRANPQAVTFGTDRPPTPRDFGVLTDHSGTHHLCHGERQLLAVSKLRLRGSHNLANALAACALMDAAGVAPDADSLAALAAFGGLEHRLETVAEIDGVTFINDSKATNLGATLAALAALPGCVLIAGGLGKGADFRPLAAAATRLRHAVLIGEDAARLERALAGHAATSRASDLAAAVRQAFAQARAGDDTANGKVVLFSPACASFDMFADFEARGHAFQTEVRALAAAQRGAS